MEFLWSSASDLVTGSGLPALASADAGVAYAAAGGALGAALAYFEVFRRPLPFAPAFFRIVLSAAQFFSLWEAWDSDVGAGLVGIPFFFLACSAPPVGSTSEYLRDARLLSAALSALVLLSAGVYFGAAPDAPAAASAYGGELRRFLAVTDVAFAVASAERWTTAALRGAVYAVLAAFPGLPRSLLRGQPPEWLMMLYGAALVQSAQVQACALRLELAAATDAQRGLMLLVASALAVGYVERLGDPAHLSFAALALLSAGALSWAVQAKWVQRSD
jgi:hypothetical protein